MFLARFDTFARADAFSRAVLVVPNFAFRGLLVRPSGTFTPTALLIEILVFAVREGTSRHPANQRRVFAAFSVIVASEQGVREKRAVQEVSTMRDRNCTTKKVSLWVRTVQSGDRFRDRS